MMCVNPTPKWHLRYTKTAKSPNESCSSGPGLRGIRGLLKFLLDENKVTTIQFEKWKGTDRFTRATKVLSADEYVDCVTLWIF